MKSENIKFIEWLVNRLIYRHLYSQDDIIIKKLMDIKKELSQDYDCDIDQESLDSILSQYYSDFNLDKTEDFNVGFTNNDRQYLRTTIKKIVNDVVNNKRTNDKPIIKG